MYKTRNGRFPPVIYVGHGAGNSACNGNTSKDWYDKVCGALCYEFSVRAVTVARNAVGYTGREERFYSPEQGNGKCRGKELAHGFNTQSRENGAGERGLYGVPIANAF